MKLLIKSKALLLCSLLFISISVFSQNIPAKSSRLVNDYAGVMDQGQIAALENKLVIYNDSTSTQVAIVIINDLGGDDVSNYAVKLAEAWGIGQSQKDNGVLVLASVSDRKITIQTGYGMEGVLPDAICRRIIENEIKPSFSGNDYYGGLDKATTAIFKFAAGEYKADHYGNKKKKGTPYGLIFIIFIIIVILISRSRKGYQTIGGTGTGGGFIPPFIGGGSSRGSWGDFSGGGGGGFGGFGGGSFGGGGASGSW